MKATSRYHNEEKGFTSYFLSFQGSSARIELMHSVSIGGEIAGRAPRPGLAHIALSVGSKEEVIRLTKTFEAKGIPVIGQPRLTGDGYFESVIEDPEGNKIELTI